MSPRPAPAAGALLAAVLLGALPASGAEKSAEASVEEALSRIEGLVARQAGADARTSAELDRRARALAPGVLAHGFRAAAPLARAARDRRRSPRARLYAVAFLALTRDAAAFEPLAGILEDPALEPDLRAAAAESLPSLPVPREHVREALARALSQEGLPEAARRPALAAAARLGLPSPGPLLSLARRLGRKPRGRALEEAAIAAEALERTRGEEAALALLELLDFYPERGAARGPVAASLAPRARELARARPAAARARLEAALAAEAGDPARALALLKALAEFGPAAAPALARLSRHADAEVLAASAEALAALGDPRAAAAALPDYERARDGALGDPRFSPKEGRPDPAELLARLETATAALRVLAASPSGGRPGRR